MHRLFWIVFLCAGLSGCPSGGDDDDATGGDDDDAVEDASCGASEEVVTFSTSDGVTLEADWRPASQPGRGVVVLVHMVPPSNDRTGYPPRVRDALAEEDVAILNIDRRGAGGSGGVAEDAYFGEGGRLDVEAAVRFALDPARGCAVNPDALVLVGASNGTTSVYDYVVAGDEDLPFPAAVAFLSPGQYTEAQFPLEPNQADRGWSLSFPILWLYPTNEPYSNAFVPDAPGAWSFVERGNQHGTRMFNGANLEDLTVDDLRAWIAAVQ
jgi:pimeloyl-ACP methyl ester carboxylesterase